MFDIVVEPKGYNSIALSGCKYSSWKWDRDFLPLREKPRFFFDTAENCIYLSLMSTRQFSGSWKKTAGPEIDLTFGFGVISDLFSMQGLVTG